MIYCHCTRLLWIDEASGVLRLAHHVLGCLSGETRDLEHFRWGSRFHCVGSIVDEDRLVALLIGILIVPTTVHLLRIAVIFQGT